MILYRSVMIEYLDKLGRKIVKQLPFDSDARRRIADLYRNTNIVVLSVTGCDPETDDNY